jgi:hypothetical protein
MLRQKKKSKPEIWRAYVQVQIEGYGVFNN